MRRTQTASAIGQSATGCRAGAISRDVAERESMTKNSTSKAKTKAKPSVTKAAVANAGASRKPAAKAAKSSAATAPRPAMAAKAASVSKRAAAGPAADQIALAFKQRLAFGFVKERDNALDLGQAAGGIVGAGAGGFKDRGVVAHGGCSIGFRLRILTGHGVKCDK